MYRRGHILVEFVLGTSFYSRLNEAAGILLQIKCFILHLGSGVDIVGGSGTVGWTGDPNPGGGAPGAGGAPRGRGGGGPLLGGRWGGPPPGGGGGGGGGGHPGAGGGGGGGGTPEPGRGGGGGGAGTPPTGGGGGGVTIMDGLDNVMVHEDVLGRLAGLA